MLGVLAAIQFLSWIAPTPPSFKGFSNYLVVHTLMETVSIIVAVMVFAVGWNSRANTKPGNQALLASIFFTIGCIDFSHTMSYEGMPDFVTHNESDKHLQFWMAARFIAATALLIVSLRPWDKVFSGFIKYLVFVGLLLFTVALNWVVINHPNLLPEWFTHENGLTPLKKNLEYVFIIINLFTAGVLWRKMRKPQNFNAVLLFGAVCTMAMSELFFTLYTTLTGIYNVLGHAYKVISYLLIYRALVVEAIEQPYRDLEISQEKLELAVFASNTGFWDLNLENGDAYYSPVWKSQLGYSDVELPSMMSTWESLLHPDDVVTATQQLRDFTTLSTEQKYENEYRMRHKDGSYHWILSRGQKHCDAKGVAVRIIGSHVDVTDRKKTESRFRDAVEASSNAMIMINAQGTIVMTNGRAAKLFGYDRDALVGEHLEKLIPERYREAHRNHVNSHTLDSSGTVMGLGRDIYARRKDGDQFRAEVHLSPIDGEDGRFIMASVVDITQRLEGQERINKLINYDALTGLPNRHLLKDRVEHSMSAAYRAQTRLAVLFLDLDNFKNVNDTLGHTMGDELLIEIGRRLRAQVRESDTVARVGGDEFVILLSDAEVEGVTRVASVLLKTIAKPYRVRSHELIVTPSIGISMYPDDGLEFGVLYQHADTAMYRAKQDGRNNYCFFTTEMQQRIMRTHQHETAMHQALERNQFHLVYQPQLTMDGTQVTGVEALLRWNHPELGAISPAEFIPLAEANGQIVAIGEWVLRTAIRQLKSWMNAGLPPMVMAVNISAVQFKHSDLPSLVTRILQDTEVPPEYLELELTEGIAMENPQNAIAVMNDLRTRGVRMSIDDFGTGYSSLSSLKKFNLYKLKIDQSFVRDIATDSDDRAIVTAIIQMANSLGFQTIAEGVETAAQLEFLALQGCQEVQGYLFSKPLVANELERFIRNSGYPD